MTHHNCGSALTFEMCPRTSRYLKRRKSTILKVDDKGQHDHRFTDGADRVEYEFK